MSLEFFAALLARMRKPSISLVVMLALLAVATGCTPEPKLSVVVSVRRSVAGPVLATFARETGAALDTRYLEPGDPMPAEFDVLWSDDPEAAVELAKAGRLAALPVDLLYTRPAGLFDPDGLWVGVTADVRVIVYDPQRVGQHDVPTHFEELLDPRWAPHVILADSTTRSAAWHAASLFATKGAQPTTAFFRDLRVAGAQFVADERRVLDGVAGTGPPIGVLDGEVAFGGRELGRQIGILIPDQDAAGAVLRATTLAITRRGTDSPRAVEFARYLLSAPVGRRLALMSSHIALFKDDTAPTGALALGDIKRSLPSQKEIALHLRAVRAALPGPR